MKRLAIIARMEGKINLVIEKLADLREDNRAIRVNQWAIGIGLAVIIVGVAALTPVVLDLVSKF